jgi:hypothetical protein
MQVLYGIGDTRKSRREYLKIRHSKRSRTALAEEGSPSYVLAGEDESRRNDTAMFRVCPNHGQLTEFVLDARHTAANRACGELDALGR